MTEGSEELQGRVDREELIAFLEESRDEYQDIYEEARERRDSFTNNYSVGRYHAYCDVLAWLYSRECSVPQECRSREDSA